MIDPQQVSDADKPAEITLTAIRDFILSKGGKVKYSDVFNQFRDSIVDSFSG